MKVQKWTIKTQNQDPLKSNVYMAKNYFSMSKNMGKLKRDNIRKSSFKLKKCGKGKEAK